MGAFNPNTWVAEAGGSLSYLSVRSLWTTKGVPGQPGLHSYVALPCLKTITAKKQKRKEKEICVLIGKTQQYITIYISENNQVY